MGLAGEGVGPGRVALRPIVEVESVGRFDDSQCHAVGGEQGGEAFAGGSSWGVGVDDGGEGEGVACGVFGECSGDVGVGGVGAERGDGAVAGLGGGERVGNAFADDEVVFVAGDWWAEPGEARVGAEACGRVVVFRLSRSRLEVAGLDVTDGAGGVEGGECGGEAVTGGEAASAGKCAAAGVGSDLVDAQHVVVQAAPVQPAAYRRPEVGPQQLRERCA